MTASKFNFNYPQSHQEEQIDYYHDIAVKDPYRWLENPDSEAAKAWIETQNELTFSYLAQLPMRENIKQRITQLWDFEKFGIPFKEGDRYFYFKNDGLQNQSVFYTLNSLDDAPKVLLDPNTLSEDGTIALSGLSISQDGELMAYGLSKAGSDWVEWKVREVETGEDLCDCLQWIKFSGASWTHDSQGFFYSRYDEPNEKNKLEEVNYFQKLYYHRLGMPQSEDSLIYHRPDQKEWGFDGTVTEDGRYLIISVWRGTDPKNLVFYKDLQDSNAEVIELLNEFEANYSFIDNDGTLFWFRTDLNAPRGRIIGIDINNPEKEHWQDIIPEANETLEGVGVL
ncbi:MAG: S9 family peptidase, partial [Microcystaceae cyanobacterium]